VDLLSERQAEEIVLLNLEGVTTFADYFVIASGQNARHMQALCDVVEQDLAHEGVTIRGREGVIGSGWVLLDLGDVIVHIFAPTERELYRQPLSDDHGPTGYWGLLCDVPFTHQGRSVTHRGLVVLSGPMRTALRRTRAQQCHALFATLRAVQAKIGQKRYRSVTEVQRRAETQLRRSPVGQLVHVQAADTPDGQVTLRWGVDREALAAAMRADGRYLLVTNDFSLTPARMLALYRDKDAVEKRFCVFKQDLKVRPLFVHSDERLRAMLLVNLIALLAYSLLERQAQQQGLCLTTRRLLECLSTLHVVEVEAWDGSRTCRVSAISPEQRRVLTVILRGVCGPAALPAPDPVRWLLAHTLSSAALMTSGPPLPAAA
jgi:ribosome-associated protein